MTGDPLRIDWLPLDAGSPFARYASVEAGAGRERVGLTILPGKHGASVRYPGRVYRRSLDDDLAALSAADIGRLILLVEDAELERWGDPRIAERASAAGVEVLRHPMPDGGVPSTFDEMDGIVAEVDMGAGDQHVAVACMGGVGRTGTVAACALVARGILPGEAIARVRAVRHPEAVETAQQRAFVEAYATHLAESAVGRHPVARSVG